MLLSFHSATKTQKDIGDEVAALLVTAGVALAVYVLLKAAFADK